MPNTRNFAFVAQPPRAAEMLRIIAVRRNRSCNYAQTVPFALLGFILLVCSRILTLKGNSTLETKTRTKNRDAITYLSIGRNEETVEFLSVRRDIGKSGSCEEYEERKERVENERNGGKVSESEKMKGSGGWSVNGDLGPPYMLMLD